jgi:hypothetical protein
LVVARREQEREQEAFLWSAIPDYQRAFDRIIIDPPRAAVVLEDGRVDAAARGDVTGQELVHRPV